MDQDEVIQQIATATTPPEIAAARQVWREWTDAHPDDEYVNSLSYLLDCAEEVACKRTAEWEALQVKLTTLGAAELSRDEVTRIGLSARSLAEIAHARQVLHEWEQAHPDERKMHGVYEQMYVLEDGQEAQKAEPVAVAA